MESCGLRLASRATCLLLLSLTRPSVAMKVDPKPQLRKVATSQKAMDAVSRLWGGEELDTEQLKHVGDMVTYRSVNETKVRQNGNKSSTLKMIMLGPMDAGTNLLSNALRINYPRLVRDACASGQLCRVWKHGVNISQQFFVQGEQPLATAFSNQKVRAEDTVLVAIVRSPLAQIAAWQLAPYELEPCVDRPLATYDQPCSARAMTWDKSGNRDYHGSSPFASSMDIYNKYLRMYKELKEGGQFHDVVLITYEDLVLAPEEVVADVGSAMGWPALKRVATVETPAKKHGHFVGRGEAIKRLADRWWLSQYSYEARRLVCRGLDPEAYKGLEENSHRVPGYSVMAYGADCDGYGADAAEN